MFMDFNVIVGVGTLLFGALYTAATLAMDRATIGNPIEPLLFPAMLGAGMMICGLVMIRTAVVKIKSDPSASVPFRLERDQNGRIPRDRKLIAATCLAGVIYALLFNPLGYVISTILFLGFMLFLFRGTSHWKSNLLIAVFFSLFVYLLFTKLLTIPLPMMPGDIF